MGEAPFFDLVHHGLDRFAKGGKAVFYRGRNGGKDLSPDQAVCFELAELGCQHGGGDARDLAFQYLKSFGLFFGQGV